MSKTATENDKSVSTECVAATFVSDLGPVEASGEQFWKNFDYFGAIKSDYLMEKVNFPESTLFYLNQAYLTVKKKKFIVIFLF